MDNDTITQILLAIISIVSALVTGILVPYIRTKMTKEQRSSIEYWTKMAIEAAEVYYETQPKMGKKKKDFVKDFIKKHNNKITDDQLDILIDTLVEKLINKPVEKFTE